MAIRDLDGARPFPAARHDHRRCLAAALAAAERLCRARGSRLTALRRRVLELVWRNHEPIGAYAILDNLRARGRVAAPTTVYRALDFLAAEGLVHRIESLNAFVGCIDPRTPHRGQFLICHGCGAAAELEDPRVEAAIEASAVDVGFQVASRTIEVMGLCPNCGGTVDGDY